MSGFRAWVVSATDRQILELFGLLPTYVLRKVGDCARAVIVERMLFASEAAPSFGGDAS